MTILYERRTGIDRRLYDREIPGWMATGPVLDRRKSERDGVDAMDSAEFGGEVFAPALFDDVPTMELLPELRPFWLEGMAAARSAK